MGKRTACVSSSHETENTTLRESGSRKRKKRVTTTVSTQRRGLWPALAILPQPGRSFRGPPLGHVLARQNVEFGQSRTEEMAGVDTAGSSGSRGLPLLDCCQVWCKKSRTPTHRAWHRFGAYPPGPTRGPFFGILPLADAKYWRGLWARRSDRGSIFQSHVTNFLQTVDRGTLESRIELGPLCPSIARGALHGGAAFSHSVEFPWRFPLPNLHINPYLERVALLQESGVERWLGSDGAWNYAWTTPRGIPRAFPGD